MARGIGTRLLAGGHSVTLVRHAPGKIEELATALQGAARGGASVQVAAAGSPIDGETVGCGVEEVAEIAGDRQIVGGAPPIDEAVASQIGILSVEASSGYGAPSRGQDFDAAHLRDLLLDQNLARVVC